MYTLHLKFLLLKTVGEGEGVSSDCDAIYYIKMR